MIVPAGMTFHAGRQQFNAGDTVDESLLPDATKSAFKPWNDLVAKAVAAGIKQEDAVTMSSADLTAAISSASKKTTVASSLSGGSQA
jgi:hypothetical protein